MNLSNAGDGSSYLTPLFALMVQQGLLSAPNYPPPPRTFPPNQSRQCGMKGCCKNCLCRSPVFQPRGSSPPFLRINGADFHECESSHAVATAAQSCRGNSERQLQPTVAPEAPPPPSSRRVCVTPSHLRLL